MTGKELHELIYPDAPEDWWDTGADRLRFEQSAQHLTGCIAYQARAEIVAKLRERGHEYRRMAERSDCQPALYQPYMKAALSDLNTADWIEAGCPS